MRACRPAPSDDNPAAPSQSQRLRTEHGRCSQQTRRGWPCRGPGRRGVDTSRLYNPDLSDPDLIIRTAGERRVSNFLLWQSAYSEMLVTETLWPDFDVEDLKAALADYASRVRRFGGRPEDEIAANV